MANIGSLRQEIPPGVALEKLYKPSITPCPGSDSSRMPQGVEPDEPAARQPGAVEVLVIEEVRHGCNPSSPTSPTTNSRRTSSPPVKSNAGKRLHHHQQRIVQAQRLRYFPALCKPRRRNQNPQGDSPRRMRPSRVIKSNRGQSIPAWFLLADYAGGRIPASPTLQRLSTIRNTEAYAGFGTQDVPHHLAIRRLGAGHGWPVEES